MAKSKARNKSQPLTGTAVNKLDINKFADALARALSVHAEAQGLDVKVTVKARLKPTEVEEKQNEEV